MTKDEIVKSLLDQADDKDRLAGGDPDSIFTEDATALREAAELLKAMPEWISVKDRTPSIPCLALDKFKQISVMLGCATLKTNGEWHVYDSACFDLEALNFKTVNLGNGEEAIIIKEITHWMPMPKLPEME